MKNYITLYHYSNTDIKGDISPLYFGVNSFSGISQRLSGIKRSYFYLTKTKKECYFNNSKYLYIAKTDKNKLYDIDKDIKGIIKNLKYNQDLYKVIKNKGYNGIITFKGLSQAVLFKSVKYIDKINVI